MDTRGFPGLLHGADYNYEQWLDSPEILDTDFRYMADASANVMTIGVFSWSMLEPEEGAYDFGWMDELFDRLHKNGIRAVLATPSGAKPVWMSQKYPEICRVNQDGRRDPHKYRHNHCRSSRVYRDAVRRMNTALAKRYGKHPALLMWHVSNEYNGSPCYCPDCLAGFRDWLKNRYKTLDALNKAWWTTFWSNRYTDWEQIVPGDKSLNGVLLDWQRYTSDLTLDFFRHECEPLRAITPNIPVTTNFMRPDIGLDYWAFAPYIDIISWDNYPWWHLKKDDLRESCHTAFYFDLIRSYKAKPFLLMESAVGSLNWTPVSRPKKAGMHLLSSLQAVAHGSDSVMYFQWRQSRGREEKFHSAVISHLGANDTRMFSDVANVGDALKKIREVQASEIHPEVAVIYDYHNSWALENAQMLRNVGKDYQAQCVDHYEAFWKRGIPADVIDSVSVDFAKYRIVVAPMLYMFRAGVSARLRDFVNGGGTLVVTYLSGIVDDSDLCFLGKTPAGLDGILGASVEMTDSVVDDDPQSIVYGCRSYPVSHYADYVRVEDGKTVAEFTDGDLAGMSALTRKESGFGRAYYLAARTGADFNDAFYGDLCAEAGVTACVNWPIPAGVSVMARASGESLFVFVMNFNASPVEIDAGKSAYENFLDGSRMHGTISLERYGVLVMKEIS